MRRAAALLAALLLWLPCPALAWGDDGHAIIAIIAGALLRPDVRRTVDAILATDEDPLTDHDIASAATWADHLRDANPEGARNRTRRWHFVDLEIHAPAASRAASLERACFDRVPLVPGALASLGPARSCIVDKIEQFTAELGRADTPPDERLAALKFLLHFVGDVHQPLHAADDDDRGGNDKPVSAAGLPSGNLHRYWDTEFVRALGFGPEDIAADLKRRIRPADIARYSGGTPADWARESQAVAIRGAYGRLPAPTPSGRFALEQAYVDAALADVRLQLIKAGIRLAALLNRTVRAAAPG